MKSAYLKIFSNRNFFLLWVGQVISQFGDRLTQMALIGLVYELAPNSTFSLAKIMSLPVLAVFLISPVAGVYVDRWNKRKTMFLSDLFRGIFIVALPLVVFYLKSMIIVYALIFISFCLGRFFIPAKMAVVPGLVSKEQTLMANSLISTTAMIAAMLGFGLGGIIVEKLGVRTAFFIDGLTFFISALAVFLMRTKDDVRPVFRPGDFIEMGKQAIENVRSSFVFEMKQGFSYLLKTKETRYAAKVFSLLFACIGSLYAVFIVFVQQTLSSVTIDLGYLAVSAGAGLFTGSVLYGRIGDKHCFKKVVNFCLGISSLYLLFFVITLNSFPDKLFAVISCFIVGLLAAPIVVAINTLIHKESKDGFWGRVFSSLEVIIHLAFILFMFMASFLAEKFSPFTIIVSVGIMIFVFSVYNHIFRLERNGKINDQGS